MSTSTEDAAPVAAAPRAVVDPTWRVVTHLSIIEVRATEVDTGDDDALMFLNDGAVSENNGDGVVAVVPWLALAYAFDTVYGTVIESPTRSGDGATA